MSNTPTPDPARYTLRDLPLPAKLVVTTFLISVGLGYLWAMAQIHFKHASAGEPMPTQADLVARFSGVPWPLEPKPDIAGDEKKTSDVAKGESVGLGVKTRGAKIQSLIGERCVVCHSAGGEKEEVALDKYEGIAKYLDKSPGHPHGQIHTAITGDRKAKWGKENMVPAFFEKSEGWKKQVANPETRAKLEAQREAERLALVAWIEAGAPKAPYDADAFPLPATDQFKDLTPDFVTEATALVSRPAPESDKLKPADKWKAAKRRQLSPDALTQSTHAHLLTFSVLWALTGLVLAFTRYPYVVRCVLAPIVLAAQVIDVGCWWLARLEPPAGPYFALAIMGTGGVVGLGLILQIVLSLWDLYGRRGRLVLALTLAVGVGLFGLAYTKVIEPQLQAEKDLIANEAK